MSTPLTTFPTTVDNLHSMMYAIDRLNKNKATDPEIMKKYPGVKWVSDEQTRTYICPDGLEGCEHGKFKIISEEGCKNFSQLPFKSEDGSPLPTNECIIDGTPYPDSNHGPSKDCDGLGYEAICQKMSDGEDKGKFKCIPKKSYLEWHPDSSGEGGKCIYGNFLARKWCEYPATRNLDDSGNPQNKKGFTDVPAFKYNENDGSCSMTEAYCKRMGVDWDESTKDCKLSGGQEFTENWICGKTIYRSIKQVVEGFQHQPPIIKKMADPKLATSYIRIYKDFAGNGIHIYNIEWQSGEKTLGFLAPEVRKVFPNALQSIKNKDYIVITPEMVKQNPKLKYLYFFISMDTKEMLNNITKILSFSETEKSGKAR